MKIYSVLLITLVFISSCQQVHVDKKVVKEEKEKIFAPYSNHKNEYSNFNSIKAINRLATIENEYFGAIQNGFSGYYGTQWRLRSEQKVLNDSVSQYQDYLNNLKQKNGSKPDSLHCTLYAYEGIKAGFTKSKLIELENNHRRIWKSREIAGWSIGYLLVKYFDWKAYLIIDKNSNEYSHCIKSFNKDKTYPVWRQPNIPLEKLFTIGENDSLVTNLLIKNEFGWGFSNQGIHTWVTRFEDLKECNWDGAPSKKYQDTKNEKPLFLSTKFNEYFDYDSHVVIFPNKGD